MNSCGLAALEQYQYAIQPSTPALVKDDQRCDR
jgi:hypothetical protein